MKRELTSGSVMKNLLFFSLPYLLSFFLQTLYGMADLLIIGQYGGVADTTAVSVGSQVMHMLTVMIVGLAMGATVNIGQAIGGRDNRRAALFTGNTVTLFMGLSSVLTLLLLVLRSAIVSAVSTPADAAAGTEDYLTICFIGIPFITAYNIISAVFRGMGDSKSPMYFIAVACAANIALDYLFIGVLGMGPAGAALGTVLSQAISVIISLIVIKRRSTGLALTKADIRPNKQIIGKKEKKHKLSPAGVRKAETPAGLNAVKIISNQTARSFSAFSMRNYFNILTLPTSGSSFAMPCAAFTIPITAKTTKTRPTAPVANFTAL